MRSRKCSVCIFDEICTCKSSVCSYYSPIDEYDNSDLEYVEESRYEFYDAWFEYISDYNDDLFY